MAGWEPDYGPAMHDSYCVVFTLSHAELPHVQLSILVCLDEMPAVVYVNLLDKDGIIESEWQDSEIDVEEIMEEAKELNSFYKEN